MRRPKRRRRCARPVAVLGQQRVQLLIAEVAVIGSRPVTVYGIANGKPYTVPVYAVAFVVCEFPAASCAYFTPVGFLSSTLRFRDRLAVGRSGPIHRRQKLSQGVRRAVDNRRHAVRYHRR